MIANRFVVVMLLLLGLPQVHAVGLGEPRLDSYLGEPLRVRAPLIVSQEELAQIDEGTVSVGTAVLFEKLGLQYKQEYGNLKLELKPEGEGAVLLMSTQRPFVEPLIELPLDIRVAGSRFVRVVTLLLDPRPANTPVKTTAVPSPVSEATPGTRPEPRKESRSRWGGVTQQGESFGPVAPNQTLGDVAEMMDYPGVSFNQKLVALWRHNPEAFLHNNMNYLMAGSTLYLPNRNEVAAIPAGDASRQVAAQSSGRVVDVAETAGEMAAEQPAAGQEESVAEPGQNLVITAPMPVEEMPAEYRQEFDTLYRSIEEVEQENEALRDRVRVLEEQVAVMSALLVEREQVETATPGADEEGVEAPATTVPEPVITEPPGDEERVALAAAQQPAAEKGESWLLQPVTYLLLLVLAVVAVIVWLYRRRRQMDRMQLFLR